MTSFPHLAQQIFNRPLAIRPEKASWRRSPIASVLRSCGCPTGRIRAFGCDILVEGDAAADCGAGYEVIAGVGIIEVHGTLVQHQLADIDTNGELFVSSVARYRGISATKVRAQEASVFLGAKAREAGLIDAVMSPAEAFGALVASMNRPPVLNRRPR